MMVETPNHCMIFHVMDKVSLQRDLLIMEKIETHNDVLEEENNISGIYKIKCELTTSKKEINLEEDMLF